MATTRLALGSRQLPSAAAAVIYTVPAGAKAMIAATVCNDTTTAVTFSLWKPREAGSPADSNLLVNARSLGSGESYRVQELAGQIFDEGWTLQGIASVADQVTITGGVVLFG